MFLNPLGEIARHKTNLPHWQQDGASIFVTFRLADALPAEKLMTWMDAREAWLRLHPRPWSSEKEGEYHRLFTETIEAWLDAGSGACLLRDPRVAGIVGEALAFFDGERCRHHAWVVMPNHVHVLFSPLGEWKLEQLLHSWKSYTANEVNKLLGRKGELWQRDYYDRLVRDREHFERCVEYICLNPEKAGLREGEFLSFER